MNYEIQDMDEDSRNQITRFRDNIRNLLGDIPYDLSPKISRDIQNRMNGIQSMLDDILDDEQS